jgi:hypothetical protein
MIAYQPRRAIQADDPHQVFVEEAKLLAVYSERIEGVVKDIRVKFSDPDARKVAATAYVAKLGENIPDETIRGAVKTLAVRKCQLSGVM